MDKGAGQKFRVFVRLRPVQQPPTPRERDAEEGTVNEAAEKESTPRPSARGQNGQCTVEHRIITLHDPNKVRLTLTARGAMHLVRTCGAHMWCTQCAISPGTLEALVSSKEPLHIAFVGKKRSPDQIF